MNFFKGRTLLIATKHEKEKVLAPMFEQALGVNCVTLPDFDTDKLGTFSGEVERIGDPLETARRKCFLALENTDFDLVLASEGSFGPHPTIFFSYADDELLLLFDKKNGFEIISRFLTTETNFNAQAIDSKKQLIDFAKAVKFPSHGLIMKKSKSDFSRIEKGINTWDKLNEAYSYFNENYNSVYVETDMRALYNPSRMEFISKVGEKLVSKILSVCPQCEMPGFGITAVQEGLPCNNCNTPTRSTLSYEYVCEHCDFSRIEKFPNGKTSEEPMFCDVCNP
jgi:hypothetical protein